MPPSVKPKMFIAATGGCEEITPPRTTHSPVANSTVVDSSRNLETDDGRPTGPSPKPVDDAMSTPTKSRPMGFSVCDILTEQRSSKLKTVPLIVVSGNSRSVKLRSTDFSPIMSTDNQQRSSPPCSNRDYSLSPAPSKANRAQESPAVGHPDISRKLKFGVDRILSDSHRVPALNSHVTTGEVCGPNCTCADEIAQMPTFVNSRPSYRNTTLFEYPVPHPQVPCDFNRHTVYYPSNVLTSPYAPTPWTIQSHYGHHHLLHPIATTVYPVTHIGAGNALIDSSRGFHHFQNHHHGGLSIVGGGPNGPGTNSAVSGASSGTGISSNAGKRKRSWSRAVFSNLQRKGLEKRFQIQKYITKPDRRQLAATLGLTDAQVKVWFQNRRMKWRHSKEAKEEMAKQNSGSAAKVTEPTECRKLDKPNVLSEPISASDKQSDVCLKNVEQT